MKTTGGTTSLISSRYAAEGLEGGFAEGPSTEGDGAGEDFVNDIVSTIGPISTALTAALKYCGAKIKPAKSFNEKRKLKDF